MATGFRGTGENGSLQCKADVDQLSEYATGANASVELYEKLVAFGRKHGIIICNDNPYSFILNEHPLSILSIPGAKEICIEMNSMSKAHNMPGWRMAMLLPTPNSSNGY